MGELIPNTTTKFILSAALIIIITVAIGALFSNSFLPWIKGFITEWNPFRPAEGWELTIISKTDFTEPIPEWVIDRYLEETFEEVVEIVPNSKEDNVLILTSMNLYDLESNKEIITSINFLLDKIRDYKKRNTNQWANLEGGDKLKLKEPLFLWGILKNLPLEERGLVYYSSNFNYFRNKIINKKVFGINPSYVNDILLSQGADAYKIIYPSFSGTSEKVYSEFIQSSSSGTQFYCPLWSNGEKSSTGGICEGSRVKSNSIKLVAQGGLKNDNELFMFWTDDEGDPLCKEDKEDKSISPRSSCTIKMNGNKKIFVKAAPFGLLERFS